MNDMHFVEASVGTVTITMVPVRVMVFVRVEPVSVLGADTPRREDTE